MFKINTFSQSTVQLLAATELMHDYSTCLDDTNAITLQKTAETTDNAFLLLLYNLLFSIMLVILYLLSEPTDLSCDGLCGHRSTVLHSTAAETITGTERNRA